MPKALVGVADIKHAARISLHAHRIVDHVAYDAGPRLTSAVVQIGDPPDIVLRLGEAGNTGTPGHRARPGVVRRQAQLDVAPVSLQQTLQMSNPGVYVLLRGQHQAEPGGVQRRGGRGGPEFRYSPLLRDAELCPADHRSVLRRRSAGGPHRRQRGPRSGARATRCARRALYQQHRLTLLASLREFSSGKMEIRPFEGAPCRRLDGMAEARPRTLGPSEA